LIALTREARQHVRALSVYYEERDRPEATLALRRALSAAWAKITASPAKGLPAPRPYPQLVAPGRLWIKSGRYWIAYRTEPSLTIIGVFFETANIPGRV
jgi:plasmid stabilization system protein ParE